MLKHRIVNSNPVSEMQLSNSEEKVLIAQADDLHHPVNVMRKSQYAEAGYEVKSDSPEWDEMMEKLAAEIKVRHYSRKTLKMQYCKPALISP